MGKEDPVSREECQNSMARLHERVDKIAESSTKIETAANSIKESIDEMYTLMYGNGKNGIITKIASIWTKINIQWCLLFLILTGIIGLAWRASGK